MSYSAFAKKNAEIYVKIEDVGEIKVTSTGSSTATSLLSYEDALEIAKENAYKVALSVADNDANIINQTITIINQNNKESITTNSITTDSITTNSLTADSITTNSITTDSITTDSITADSITTNSITTNSITTDSITTDSITANNVITNALQMSGNIKLSTLFTTPILGQLGYINNITSLTAKSLVTQTSVILSQITITPGVWQVFYKFKYYNIQGGYKGGIYSYIYELTTSSTLCNSSNYQGFLSNQYAYSAGRDGFFIGPSPTFESNKESLIVSITQNTTYYLQFGLDSGVAAQFLNAIAMNLYAVRIA